MLTYTATLISLVLPTLALVTPQRSLQGRAGGAIGNTYAGAPVSNITVKADNVVQCGTAYISWTGATDPVSLFIALGGLYVGETPITTLSDLRGGSTTWLVNQAAGKTMEFRVTDAKGAVAYVQNIKIGAGDIWCLDDVASANAVATTSEAAWSESAVPAWTPEPSATTTSSADQAAAAPVASSTTRSTSPSPSTKTSTSSSRSSTTTTPIASTTAVPTTSVVSTTASTSSSASNASLAGAGAGASASARSGVSRSVVFGSGTLAVLVSVMALGLAL